MGRNKKKRVQYDPEVRRKKQIQLMREAQIAYVEYEAAEKRLNMILDESYKFGVNLNDSGEVTPTDRFTNMSWDIINFRGLSRMLAGGELNITRDIIPKRYAIEVHRMLKANERALKNIFSQRHQKAMREKKKELLLERKKKLRTKKAAK